MKSKRQSHTAVAVLMWAFNSLDAGYFQNFDNLQFIAFTANDAETHRKLIGY